MASRSEPTWYKDAIIYEIHVRAFYDSVTDGIGDFGGLTQKLDYLEDLGVTALWLLPFCPSPLRDDGYDISNYNDVNPSYGSLRDFQRFLKEAHRRGLRVITELVLNHTSDQHEWFQRSRRAAKGSRWRNYYVWSDTPEKYAEARIIFKDFEASNWTWDPVAKSYYWHRFYSHQPDLNWDNPEVKQAMLAAMDFWFDMGVDGLRLDAVPYLFEREGTNCENLPETHAALREVRAHVEERYHDKMLLAEANQWPEDSVEYFGAGDECHMAFNFPVMPRMFMSLQMEDRHPLTDIMKLTPSIPANCQWALFLRNHDELTLEMVTDEERDYMYRTYAHDRQMRINLGIRRRLAPLLENDRRKIELMNALLFSLPGTPILYYGDEIGMGDNVYLGDRNGVRTPMQWSADRNAGFSRANPQRLFLPVNIDPEYHYEAVNVETQQRNPHSLLWWMKRSIAQRKQFRAFGRGTLEFLYPANRKVLAFFRQFEDERILVVANLSRFSQGVELDLQKYQGSTPLEIFGVSRFPAVTQEPYFLSLAPYSFYWFKLLPKEAGEELVAGGDGDMNFVTLTADSSRNIWSEATLEKISRVLPRLLRIRRWFLGRHRVITQVKIEDVIPVRDTDIVILLAAVEYRDGEDEKYVIPIAIASGKPAEDFLREHSEAVLAKLEFSDQSWVLLHSALFERSFSDALLTAVLKRSKFKGTSGELVAGHTKAFREAWAHVRSNREPQVLSLDSPNTFVNLGEDFVAKLYREVEVGINPDREIEEFLTDKTSFSHMPRALGWLEYCRHDNDEEQRITFGLLTSYVRNATLGWQYTIDHLSLYFERALAVNDEDSRTKDLTNESPLSLAAHPVPALAAELLGSFENMAYLLGIRTAELHGALSSRPEVQEFSPEPFTDFYRHGLYHGMLGLMGRSLEGLRARVDSLPENVREAAEELLASEAEIRKGLLPLRDQRISGARIRIHGDYQLGNLLFTGNDVIVRNFDGPAGRPLSERRIKRSALRDVASMIRSLHYAAHAVSFGYVPGVVKGREQVARIDRWAEHWHRWVSGMFLQGYLKASEGLDFLPKTNNEKQILLRAHLIEKALLEIAYELEYRPEWVGIPVHGLSGLLKW
ncbi:MAG TPA: maltose alpha-D-glucosyltransferase [Candidatus Saccharimonadales bacterium]|nr:maltose alpha-D-glucosyltransferase [Candidatus Saccharimonadales bacterium]